MMKQRLLFGEPIAHSSRFTSGMRSSDTPEWYTPRHIIDRVIAVLGTIDLDPCSNDYGDRANVPAEKHYTIADHALSQPWCGKVYMNPPYGSGIGRWTARLLAGYHTGDVPEAIALLPARTDTAWFQPMLGRPICWVRGRLRFSGAANSAPFPSAIVYFGTDEQEFIDAFENLGRIK